MLQSAVVNYENSVSDVCDLCRTGWKVRLAGIDVTLPYFSCKTRCYLSCIQNTGICLFFFAFLTQKLCCQSSVTLAGCWVDTACTFSTWGRWHEFKNIQMIQSIAQFAIAELMVKIDLFLICGANYCFRQSRRATWREQRYMQRMLLDRRIRLWIIGEWVLVLMPSLLVFRLPSPPNRFVFHIWTDVFLLSSVLKF